MMRYARWVLLLAAGIGLAPALAQDVLVLAGANDSPNALINGVLDGSTLSFRPEVLSGGTTPGQTNYLYFAQVRAHRSAVPGCSLIAQTNDNDVSIYTVDANHAITLVPGSPFEAGPEIEALAWAPDGGALYVPIYDTSLVAVFAVSCSAGVVTVTSAGTVALSGMTSAADAWVIGGGPGSHVCLAGRASNNVGCFAIDATTRLLATQPVNTVAVGSARGVRVAPNGCAILAVGNAAVSQGARIDATGTIALTNTAPTVADARYGAITADGTLAAMGSAANGFSVYAVNAACELSPVGINAGSPGNPFVEYMVFDSRNRLYVADSLANRIRVFAPTSAAIGPAIVSTLTNHATTQSPVGIDVLEFPLPDLLFADGFE